MAGNEVREDIVRLVVAAYGDAPDAALMRELEAIVDGGGALLDVADALTAGERWRALYPASQTPGEFADAWLGNLLPGAGPAALAVGRDVVVGHLDDGDGAAGLVLAAQRYLSGPVVSADFAGLSRAFIKRGEAAAAELAGSEAKEDVVQLAVAAYGAAPDAALMRELDAITEDGGALPEVAAALTADERWKELYPSSQTPGEFADAWLGNLLPGADPALLAAAREIVVGYIDAGNNVAALMLAAQEYLSDPAVPAEFSGAAGAFFSRGEATTARATINAPNDPMPGDQDPGGGQDPSEGQGLGGDQGSGGGQTPGGGGQTSGGGGQTSSDVGDRSPATPSNRDTMDDQNRVVLTEFDEDGNGAYDRAEAYEYGAGNLKTRIAWYDDWALKADGAGEDLADQTIDRVLVVTDADGDGIWESRWHRTLGTVGGERLTVRSVFDGDSDGSWDRAEAYAYDAANGNRLHFTRIGAVTGVDNDPADEQIAYIEAVRYNYDDAGGKSTVDHWTAWDDSKDIAGNGAPDVPGVPYRPSLPSPVSERPQEPGQHQDPVRPEVGEPDDAGPSSGVGQTPDGVTSGGQAPATPSSRDTMDDQNRVVLTEFDENEDGVYERAEAYEYGAGNLKTRITWYDDWTLKADGAGEDLADQTIDRMLVVTDADGDGIWESRWHQTLGTVGGERLTVRSVFDGDSDGSWDRAEAYAYDTANDNRLHLTRIGSVTGVDDDPADERIAYIEAVRYNYDDAGGKSTVDHWTVWDDSKDIAGNGAPDVTGVPYRPTLPSSVSERPQEPERSQDSEQPQEPEQPGVGEPDDAGPVPGGAPGAPKGVKEIYDDQGRAVLIGFDDDGDGTHDRAEAYEYGAGGLKTKTSWYDDWALGTDGSAKGLAGQTIDRVLTVTDNDGDGTGESRQHDTYDAAGELVLTSLFDIDAADGEWERAEGFEYDASGQVALRKTGEVAGADPESAAVVWSGAEIRLLNAAGERVSRFFDAYDGTSDFAALSAGKADRIHRFGLDLDGDGDDDARIDKMDAGGRIVESLFDIDGDGADRAEAYAYDAAGRRTETRFFDSWAGSFGLSGETPDKVHGWTYGADSADKRWLNFLEDFDGDGIADARTTVTYQGAGGIFATRRTDYDDGTGTGAADDGSVDRSRHETFSGAGLPVETKHDDDGDGVWDRTDDRATDARHTYDSAGRTILSEFDTDGDGIHDRAVAYEYGSRDLIVRTVWVKTSWYDAWAVEADGAGRDLADQTIDRELLVTDVEGGDGWVSRSHRTFGTVGGERLVVRALFDNNSDSDWDRAEAYTYDTANGNRLHFKRVGAVTGIGDDPSDDQITYIMAERYNYSGAGGPDTVDHWVDWDDSTDIAGNGPPDISGMPYRPSVPSPVSLRPQQSGQPGAGDPGDTGSGQDGGGDSGDPGVEPAGKTANWAAPASYGGGPATAAEHGIIGSLADMPFHDDWSV